MTAAFRLEYFDVEGWIYLGRPAGLTPADFLVALNDLKTCGILDWKSQNGVVFVRWNTKPQESPS